MKYIVAVMDLQFGSTGKGQIAGTVADVWCPDTVATAWGPNAGHTSHYKGTKYVHTMLATSALVSSVEHILIGPGSVVHLPHLAEEISFATPHLKGKHLIIHPQAAVWRPHYMAVEADLRRIGSTMKGAGEGLICKIRREEEAIAAKNGGKDVYDALAEAVAGADMSLAVSSRQYDRAIDRSNKMMLEGSQGFSLGIHTRFYPYTTSRDISTAQLLADCRIPYPMITQPFHVIGVARTYPIRVANRYDDTGLMIGTSGGCYSDQEEIQWDTIGREPELTTVTKLPRRLFTFSAAQIREAARVVRPNSVALTFCDYVEPNFKPDSVCPQLPRSLEKWTLDLNYLKLVSFGPTPDDVWEVNGFDALKKVSGSFLPGHL